MDESMRDIRQKILDEFGRSVGMGAIIRWKKDIDDARDTIKKLNESIKEKVPYRYDEESMKVMFPVGKNKEIPMPLKLIDEIFASYTIHWKDLTQQECIEHFRLNVQSRNLLKSRMWLTKQSNIMSPITMQKLDAMWWNILNEKIEEALDEHIHDKYKGRFKPNYEKSFKKFAKKELMKIAGLDTLLEHIRTYLIHYKPIEIDFTPTPIENNEVSTYVFSDIHLGMEGTDTIVQRLHRLTNDMIQDKSSIIHIVNLGDLAETFVEGGMHPWQVENMDWLYGFDLMLFVVKQFEDMIINLHREWKQVTFTGIGWNHDRILQNHNQDIRRTGALIVYELLKRWLQNLDVQIDYLTEKINVFQKDNMNLITHHWDDGFDKRKPEDILWKHGRQDMENIILMGDKHHTVVTETKNALMIWLSALANRWEYSKRIDVWSKPWYVIIRRTKDGVIDVLLRRIP